MTLERRDETGVSDEKATATSEASRCCTSYFQVRAFSSARAKRAGLRDIDVRLRNFRMRNVAAANT